ncbi:MAG: hypothetical protein ACYT04_31785 [Nostoc sp.]
MNNDVVIFIISAGLLVMYLVFSALTEMGTKLPWVRFVQSKPEKEDDWLLLSNPIRVEFAL